MSEPRHDPFPDEMLRFIEANIGSVEHLEILRILSEAPEQTRGVTELARACQMQEPAAIEQLVALEKRGLLKLQSSSAQLISYGAGSAEREEMLRRLLRYYRERPVTLINLIYRNRHVTGT